MLACGEGGQSKVQSARVQVRAVKGRERRGK